MGDCGVKSVKRQNETAAGIRQFRGRCRHMEPVGAVTKPVTRSSRAGFSRFHSGLAGSRPSACSGLGGCCCTCEDEPLTPTRRKYWAVRDDDDRPSETSRLFPTNALHSHLGSSQNAERAARNTRWVHDQTLSCSHIPLLTLTSAAAHQSKGDTELEPYNPVPNRTFNSLEART